MRISDWSSDVCSSDLRGLLVWVGVERGGDRGAGRVRRVAGRCDAGRGINRGNRRVGAVPGHLAVRDITRFAGAVHAVRRELLLATDADIGFGRAHAEQLLDFGGETGREEGWERVWQDVTISGVAGTLKKQIKKNYNQ